MTPTLTPDSKPKLSRAPKAAVNEPQIEKSLLDGVSTDGAQESTPAPILVYRPGVLVKPLTSLYETIGGFLLLGDPVCGQAVISGAKGCAESLDELARTNPAVRRVLMNMVQTGAITKVIIAHMPLILAVMSHHFPNALVAIVGMFQRMAGTDGDGDDE